MAAFDGSIELDPALRELASLILAITAINAWNRIAVSSGLVV